MLPPVEVFADSMKPLEKRYTNASKRSRKSKAYHKHRYYENLAKNLMDPANASKRATGRFSQILEAMEDARKGYKYFYPYYEGTTEASLRHGPQCGPQGQGQYTQRKVKGKAAWQHIHYNLLDAGLQVANARPPAPTPPLPPAQGHHWLWQCWVGSSTSHWGHCGSGWGAGTEHLGGRRRGGGGHGGGRGGGGGGGGAHWHESSGGHGSSWHYPGQGPYWRHRDSNR